MRIGFVGAHRSGKTTLAKIVAAQYGIPLVGSAAGSAVKNAGFDMAHDNRLETGVEMQWEIFAKLCGDLERAGASYVADRTPIDVAAYMLADATAGAGTPEAQAQAVRMMERAIARTQDLFDVVILVPPAIEFAAEAGKPPMNTAYQEHHHMLCRGILFDEDLDVFWDEIRRVTIDLGDRMDFVRGTIGAWNPTLAIAA